MVEKTCRCRSRQFIEMDLKPENIVCRCSVTHVCCYVKHTATENNYSIAEPLVTRIHLNVVTKFHAFLENQQKVC